MPRNSPLCNRFSMVHIDLVGPLPPFQGYVYLLTHNDRFTHWWTALLKVLPKHSLAHGFFSLEFHLSWPMTETTIRISSLEGIYPTDGNQAASQHSLPPHWVLSLPSEISSEGTCSNIQKNGSMPGHWSSWEYAQQLHCILLSWCTAPTASSRWIFTPYKDETADSANYVEKLKTAMQTAHGVNLSFSMSTHLC